MERKILVEVTEEEYEKIKNGILEEEPKVVTEIKEVPVEKEKEKLVLMDKKAKFSINDRASFTETNFSDEIVKREGKIVGITFTTRPPIFYKEEKRDEEEKPTILYLIEYCVSDSDCSYMSLSYVEEKNITLISKENTNESK